MNREEALDYLVNHLETWGELWRWFIDDWKHEDSIFCHPEFAEITIHDWNLAKIKSNTKIRIESPEHSEYVQKLAFEAGFNWGNGKRSLKFVNESFLLFDDGRITFCDINSFGRIECKEINIEIPKEQRPAKQAAEAMEGFNAKVLAEKVNASDVLSQGAKHLSDRAVTYDSPQGERSMAATVEAFESITGHALTEEQGWLFMVLLKSVRSQQGEYKLDNYEDGAAYFALMAEAGSGARK